MRAYRQGTRILGAVPGMRKAAWMDDGKASPDVRPSIKPHFISHGTLGSKDLAATRKFY